MWPIGVANIIALFARLVGRTKRSQFFADFDKFVVLTSRSDAYIFRSGDYCGDDDDVDDDRRQTTRRRDRDRQKPIALPLAHARGVIRMIVIISDVVYCISYSSS